MITVVVSSIMTLASFFIGLLVGMVKLDIILMNAADRGQIDIGGDLYKLERVE